MTELPYVRQPVDFPVRYAYGPDSAPQPGVPRGKIVEHEWSESRVFPGTSRRYWVYVPAQYTDSQQASLMVFQDGWMYLDPEGEIRAGVVFDNLIYPWRAAGDHRRLRRSRRAWQPERGV